MHLANWQRRVGRRDGVAEPPSGAAERLGQPRDGDCAFAHAGPGGQYMVVARITNMFVDLIGDRPHIVLAAQLGDQVALAARENAPGGIVRSIDDHRPGARRERGSQSLGVEFPIRTLHRNEHGLGAGKNRVRAIVLVERFEHDDFIAGIDQRQENRRHGFGRATGDRDLPFRIDLHAVPPVVFLGDCQSQSGGAPGDCVLIDVSVDRGARCILHRRGHREIGKSLREVDRIRIVGDPRHFANHALGERRAACCSGHLAFTFDRARRMSAGASIPRPPSSRARRSAWSASPCE